MPKQVRLDDNADIYKSREHKTEREKLKDMTFRNKFEYLWEYYKVHALIVIIVISLLSYIVYTIVRPQPTTVFYTAIINNTIDTQILDEYAKDFAAELQLDPSLEELRIDYNFYLDGDTEYSMSMQQVFATRVATAEIDVIIAPESKFESYAHLGYFKKLSDQMPTDLYSSLSDNFYLSDTQDDNEQNVYGIYLTDTELFKTNANNTDPYVLGFVVNAKNKDNSIDFIRFLFHMYP